MYARSTSKVPLWLVGLLVLLLGFGGCYLWRGLIGFLETGGNIVPATQAPSPEAVTVTVTAPTRTAWSPAWVSTGGCYS